MDALGSRALLQLVHDLAGDLRRAAADIDDDRVFVGRRFLQARELAVEQANGHEVSSRVGPQVGSRRVSLASFGREPRVNVSTSAEGIPPAEFKDRLRWFAKDVMPAFR